MESLVSIFEQYGWGGIIGIIICIVIGVGIQLLNKKLEKNITSGLEKVGEKLTNQLSKQNEQLINTIVTQQDKLVNHLLDKENQRKETHSEMINDKIKLADEINNSLKEIMITHQSQRAFIIEFHNSNNNLSGIPFAKYSCTYEWFDKGVFPLVNKCNALQFSQIAKITMDIINSNNQLVIYEDMEQFADENPSIWSSLIDDKEHIKTKKLVYSAMYDKNNILIGLVCLEYQKEHEITEEEINQLKVETVQLTSIINLRYKYSTN